MSNKTEMTKEKKSYINAVIIGVLIVVAIKFTALFFGLQ